MSALASTKQIFSFIVNRHQEIFRYAFIALIIFVIGSLFPQYGKFKYEYELGKPWKYETLLAPYDFGIEKSEGEIQKERKDLIDKFVPYYRLDTTVAKKNLAEFHKNYQENWSKFSGLNPMYTAHDSAMYLVKGIEILKSLYKKGIILVNDAHKGDPTRLINVLSNGNVAEKKRLSELFTVREANETIEQDVEQYPKPIQDLLTNLIRLSIDYNIQFDEETTNRFLNESLEQISLTRGGVMAGEKIIMQGDIVTESKYQVINSLKNSETQRSIGKQKSFRIKLGNWLLSALVIVILVIFIRAFTPEAFKSNQKLMFILLLITAMILIVSSLVQSQQISVLYAIPLCIVPIILRTFFGARLALHVHLALVLLVSFIVPLGIEFTLIQLLAGMVAIFTTIKAYYWSQFFASNAYILVTYLVGFLATTLIQGGDLGSNQLTTMGMLTLNVLLTLLAYPLIPVFEKLLGFVSEITLLELSDINKPLLKDLAIKAPGTFQHSLAVANLSEAAAYEVGANSLLSKVGALYHDVGKMQHPTYFIENQRAGINPHDDLPYEESAAIIIGHVKLGVEMAKKHKLPDIIIDFIRTHHGTTRVQYFYQSFIKNFPEKRVNDRMFRYPGPSPYSKETAIVMMADTCEAASRSLKDPTNEDIEELVERLVQNKIEQDQFNNAEITFKEISTVKKVIKKMLVSMYHARIAYPKSKTETGVI